MKRVLITGASGFIGSNVLQYLLNNTTWTFTIVSSFKHMGNPMNVPLSNRVMVYTADITTPLPDMGVFDYIIHIASESHVDRSISDPVTFIENNVSSTLQVLEYARKYPTDRFIMFSTDEVYGARKHRDWDVLLPTNPYAASKAAQEMIAISYFNTYRIPVIITNSNNIVGPNQHPEKFVPKLIKLISEGKEVEIHAQNGKLGKRFYNPVQNVAEAIRFILERKYEITGVKPPRYSLTGGRQMDNLEMAKLIAAIIGKKLRYKTVEVGGLRPTYDAFYTESDDTKLKDLGWKPPVKLEEGLRWIQ